jgi:hypothetical protein
MPISSAVDLLFGKPGFAGIAVRLSGLKFPLALAFRKSTARQKHSLFDERYCLLDPKNSLFASNREFRHKALNNGRFFAGGHGKG